MQQEVQVVLGGEVERGVEAGGQDADVAEPLDDRVGEGERAGLPDELDVGGRRQEGIDVEQFPLHPGVEVSVEGVELELRGLQLRTGLAEFGITLAVPGFEVRQPLLQPELGRPKTGIMLMEERTWPRARRDEPPRELRKRGS
jgi:hypothetical protein